MAISSTEAHYIIESCLTDFRIDGRTQLQHRPYTITNRSTKSKSSNVIIGAPTFILSNGSSRIHLPGSTTDVLCSVKADLVHPSPSKPNEGVVELHVDLSLCGGGGSASGGGGAGGGQKRRRQQREDESQITSLLQRLLLPHAVNYKQLAIWPGRYVWRLSIDVVILRCDGCVLDACSMSIREALVNTRLPKVQAVMEGHDNGDGNGGGSSSKNDLMVDGDIHNAIPPAGAEDCPLVVTVSVLNAPVSLVLSSSSSSSSKQKQQYRSISIIDARTEEEACASSRVCVSVDPNGMVCGVHTLSGACCGSVVEGNEEDDGGEKNAVAGGSSSSMPLAMLGGIVTSAAMAAKNLYELLDGKGNDSEKTGSKNGGLSKKKSVEEVSDGYGYLLKNHFLIQ